MKNTLIIFACLLLSVFAITIAAGQTGYMFSKEQPIKTDLNWKTKDYTTVVTGGVDSKCLTNFAQICGRDYEGFYAINEDGSRMLCTSYQYNAARKCVTVTYADGRTAQYYHI